MSDRGRLPGLLPGRWPGIVEAYRDRLDLPPAVSAVTLLEGNTPLVQSRRLAAWISGGRPFPLYLKLESANPSGSFKDRGMTVAVSAALARGAEAVICASTGNTSASAAAYAARAGIGCVVLLPHGSAAVGKLSQALMHGARVISVEGNFDAALALVREIAATRPMTLVNSVNPDRIAGQKTAAFEVCDALGAAPAFHALPVGNAGNITAHWLGYTEYALLGRISTLPRMIGVQAAGAAPIVDGAPVADPRTVASAIRIGNPASWQQALAARDESGGTILAVTDEEILAAYGAAAGLEGVFCEPASAAGLAGLRRLWREGYFDAIPDASRLTVCTLTGHGLKDPDTALAQHLALTPTPAHLDAVLAAAGIE